MSRLPGIVSTSLTPVRVRLTGKGSEQGKGIVLDSSVSDSGNTPTWRIRPGLMVVLKTSTGRYVACDDVTGDQAVGASVTSLVDIATWNTKTLILSYKGGPSFTVTGTAADTVAQAIIDCNANSDFKANFVASNPTANKLKIATKEAGADVYFMLGAGTENDVGGAGVTFTAGSYGGSDPDVLVIDGEYVDVKDTNGVTVNAFAVGYGDGLYQLSSIRNSTQQGLAVMRRKGSEFR